ncbi:MAG: DUF1566 domain-containing protein, partial [Spirochaetales bacterium]|nr:DUF1566 domain-containing protein [Spirochaetales bacterium]
GTISLPRTGQTVKDVDYDDGYYQAGTAWPTPRFTDNNNGTVTDNLTALIWEKTPPSSALNWTSAISYANDLVLAGFSDWHLPNINELESLLNAGVDNLYDWLELEGFGSIPEPDGLFWTSTTYAPINDNAWFIQMSPMWQNGYIWYQDKDAPSFGTSRAWAVRSGR